MDRWAGKFAIVTGASGGIGRAICKSLLESSVNVIGVARTTQKLQELHDELQIECRSSAKFYPWTCDLTKKDQLEKLFKYVEEEFGGVDILINNAGVVFGRCILDEDSDPDIHMTIETNFSSVVRCCRMAVRSMVARNSQGYIVNISSVLGHAVPSISRGHPLVNVYPCTKFALTAFTQIIQKELIHLKMNNVRVSNVSPGVVRTAIIESANIPATANLKYLEPSDIAEAILYILATPERVQIQDIIIKPNGERF